MELKKGYKQTEIGIIPNDWEVKNLGNTANIVSGGTPSTNVGSYWNGNINWFTPTEIGLDKYAYESKRKISVEGLESSSARILPVNTIILTTRAGIGDLSILKIEACTNQGFQSFISNSNTDNEYLYYLLSTLKKEFLKNASGSTFLEISPNKLKSILVATPTLKEQTAIANALSDTDPWINSLEQLLTKKRQIKQGAMQELLQPKEGWEVKKLGEIATFLKGKGLPKSDITENGKHKCIHYGELFTKYKESIYEILSYTNQTENTITSIYNDVLMPTSDVTPNGLATASCIKENGVILGGDVLIIRPSKLLLDGIYLSYFISKNKERVMMMVTGSTVYHLYGSDMSNMIIEYPTLQEQIRIATILSDMDEEIGQLESKLEKAKQLKQGMMQELLTGRIRLV